MQSRVWIGVCIGAALIAGLTVGLRSSQASGMAPATHVGSVDVGKVFTEYQRKKDLDEEMKQAEQKVNLEMQTRRNKIDSFQAVVDAMSPDDPMYVSKTRELLQMQIEFKNWFDLKQADMTREVGLWTTRIYQDITEAVADVAKREGYDIVLFHDEFRPRGLDPDQLQDQISRRRVLYVSPGADLTRIVSDTLDAKYRAQPKGQMLQLP